MIVKSLPNTAKLVMKILTTAVHGIVSEYKSAPLS